MRVLVQRYIKLGKNNIRRGILCGDYDIFILKDGWRVQFGSRQAMPFRKFLCSYFLCKEVELAFSPPLFSS